MLDKLLIVLLIAGISNAQTVTRSPNQLMDLSVHILDATRGLPAVNCRVNVFKLINNDYVFLSRGQTDLNGRFDKFIDNSTNFNVGRYKIQFETGAYFTRSRTTSFYPYIDVIVDLLEPIVHFHLPITVSQYAYTLYKGLFQLN
ncbi:unnamed protein product [Diamesa serratosioi]